MGPGDIALPNGGYQSYAGYVSFRTSVLQFTSTIGALSQLDKSIRFKTSLKSLLDSLIVYGSPYSASLKIH